jgi:ribosomal protein L30/L7E
MIAVLRIAGRANNKTKDDETLNRLNLDRKFACILVDEKDAVRKGMVRSVAHLVAYGKVSEDFVKEMKKARGKKDEETLHLHPPRGGFKKRSDVAMPKGILGEHEDITKLIGRML